MMKNKFIVTFAGVPGSSKSPVANHLSFTFGLPILISDQIRYEVKEDLLNRMQICAESLGRYINSKG